MIQAPLGSVMLMDIKHRLSATILQIGMIFMGEWGTKVELLCDLHRVLFALENGLTVMRTGWLFRSHLFQEGKYFKAQHPTD